MKIILDAFGGDNAPLCILQGSRMAIDEYGAEILLCGDTEKIKACAAENGISLDGMEIKHAPRVMDMHDDPNTILQSNSDTSLAVALGALANGEGDAVVSAGSTGAVLFGATFIEKRIKGIKRPAIGTVMPGTERPYMLIDAGANLNCRPEMLMQFAILGSAYMKKVMGIERPTVGLLNNGAEDTKGGEVLVGTYQLLKKSNLNFIGNVEARDVPRGACDVLVADGFAGNVVLKLTEGIGAEFMGLFKDILMKNALTKLAALMIKPGLRDLKRLLDYSEYGGAPIVGVRKPVFKAHGSSNAKAIRSAIRQAMTFVENGVIDEIMAAMEDNSAAE
ncbi:MAG: phosphate acyltransferase PlsX [Acutalibacteraceae bacterium]